MAETCKSMMGKQGSGFWMIVPGVVFIVLGVAIILYPQILAWIVAIAFIVMGAAMLMMANFVSGMEKRFDKTRM
jgi:uncharacterized membrane protein HdeD (DUF308 family)